jgi:2-amino-4-hydroxy-6-hydroxymethyldihydropteridine diphosphokinase
MSVSHSGYLLGIGSNINPQANIAKIIHLLLLKLPRLSLSRVLKIPPIGMNSRRDFLNVVVFIETEMPETELKAICNDIEITLGRDRHDPTRKIKDRTADLDILTKAIFPDDGNRLVSNITDEYFLYPLIEEINAYLSNRNYSSPQAGEVIEVDGLTFGQSATTIDRNASTSNERVI